MPAHAVDFVEELVCRHVESKSIFANRCEERKVLLAHDGEGKAKHDAACEDHD